MPRLCSSLLLSLLIASPGLAVTMAWTPIGNPGNPCDLYPQQGCFGTVGYGYFIGTYEVTNAQYAEFLNAKAASDPLQLYRPVMGTNGNVTRTGSDGSYTYSAVTGREYMPVSTITFANALRFANWMNNGQGNGDTESGAYTLLGGTPLPSNVMTVTRNTAATVFLTSEDEWYKAAYYDPTTSSYFDFPTASNAQTICSTPTATPNRANCNGAVNPPYGDFTPAGSYPGSSSRYGTFDQAGNVWEWNEAILGDFRGMRGGSFQRSTSYFAASHRDYFDPMYTAVDLGFRLAMIPEPSTGLLVIAGLLGLGVRRRGPA